MTATAAHQLEEEKTKGMLEPGKLADLVIRDRNPLKVEPTTIKDIVVMETITEGRIEINGSLVTRRCASKRDRRGRP